MSDPLMTIREMCDHFDVTARTLRFYEAKELLFPLREGQKRLYNNRDRGRLKLILRGKRFGFSLENIRQLLDLYSIGDQMETQIRQTYLQGLKRLDQLKVQRDELDETIHDLQYLLRQGELKIAEFEQKQTK